MGDSLKSKNHRKFNAAHILEQVLVCVYTFCQYGFCDCGGSGDVVVEEESDGEIRIRTKE